MIDNEVNMNSQPGGIDPTRASLISRLRHWEDQKSWQEFFDTYWKLIYSVAVKSGLTESEAEDVVQETVISVAKKMPDFIYDPSVCSFKGWLKYVTRLRVIDQFRKRPPKQAFHEGSDRDTSRTDTIARIPDPKGLELERIWDREWDQNLVDVAMQVVKRQVKPEHYQIFYLSVVQGVPPRKVAQMLGRDVGNVYLVRHRLIKLIKGQKQWLEARRGGIAG